MSSFIIYNVKLNEELLHLENLIPRLWIVLLTAISFFSISMVVVCVKELLIKASSLSDIVALVVTGKSYPEILLFPIRIICDISHSLPLKSAI